MLSFNGKCIVALLYFVSAGILNTAYATPSAASHEKQKELLPCTLHNPNTGNSYDLNTIAVRPIDSSKKGHKDDRTESWHARGWDYGANFTMNFCAPVVEDLSIDGVEGLTGDAIKNVSAYYKWHDKIYSIGQQSSEPIFRGRKLVINYTNGSPCGDAYSRLARGPLLTPGTAKRESRLEKREQSREYGNHDDTLTTQSAAKVQRKSSIISFTCDRDPTAAKVHVSFIGASPDECSYFFEARSIAACGGVIVAQQSLGAGSVFGVIAVITIAVYVLGGIAYQRTVMHQRGWRQVPNYALWASIFGFVSDFLTIFTSSCARLLPGRKGYNQLPGGRARRDDEANGLIDSYDEEY